MAANDFTESNPPAFPLPLGNMNCAEPSQSGGMTLRDYFAGQVVAGIFAANPPIHPGIDDQALLIARSAYDVAEAMLKARTE